MLTSQVWPIEEAVESASAGNCEFATHELACSATHGRGTPTPLPPGRGTPTRTPSDPPVVSFASGAVRGGRGGGILRGEAVGGGEWDYSEGGGSSPAGAKGVMLKGASFREGGGIKVLILLLRLLALLVLKYKY